MNSRLLTIETKWFGRGSTLSLARVLGLGAWLILGCLSMFSQGTQVQFWGT